MSAEERPEASATSGLSEGRTVDTRPLDPVGTVIGHYHLLQKIGEGGMGEVWLAEQKEPVRRRVALKLVKAGMNTREVIARFASERQAMPQRRDGVTQLPDCRLSRSCHPSKPYLPISRPERHPRQCRT
jgi:serine/threonine protein kinase